MWPFRRTPLLVQHVERHLGKIQRGWNGEGEPEPWPFHVVECRGGTWPNISFFATMGLARHSLQSSSGKVIRHELFMGVPTSYGARNIPGLLHQIGTQCLEPHRPYLRGDVLGPAGVLLHDKHFEALYVTAPSCLPDDFAVCRIEDGTKVVLAWLIPIMSSEAAFVRSSGWSAFEELMERKDVDGFNLDRPAVC